MHHRQVPGRRPATLLLFFVALLTTPLVAQERPKVDSPEWKARKGAAIHEVVADLRARDVAALPEEVRVRRSALLDELDRYADSGAFPINDLFPQRLVPYFIDARDRRCALAHLIDHSGHRPLLLRLASEANNAYLSQLGDDEELAGWLERHGFSPEEVAYIQAPSIVDSPPPFGGPGVGPIAPPSQGPGGTTPPYGGPTGVGRPGGTTPSIPVGVGRPGRPTPGTPGGTPSRPGGTTPTPGVAPGAPGAPSAPSGAATPRMRRKAPSSSTMAWTDWWRLHRDDHIALRRRYHDARGISPQGKEVATKKNLRPLDTDLDIVERVFTKLRKDPALETAILMALTEPERDSKSREQLANDILEVLSKDDARHPRFAVLALGRTRSPEAISTLTAILRDDSAGRKAVAASSRVPADLRAMAAFGLGYTSDAGSVAPLHEVLADRKVGLDIRCSSALSLALLAREGIGVSETLPALVALTGDKKAPNELRVQAAAALGIIGDASVKGALLEPLRRFRGSAELRRASARSLAALGGGLERATFDVLAASARRDTDAGVRQMAIAAIGELSAHDRDLGDAETKERRELLDEVGVFLDDGVTGFFKQKSDRAWYAIAAGLHARAHETHRAAIAKHLVELLEKGKRHDDRGAAALALGLAGSDSAREPLREVLTKKNAPLLVGCTAEALGILDDQASRETLRALALSSPNEFVCYAATVGLTALGDADAEPLLVEAMSVTPSESVRAGIARALGQMGDRRSLSALLKIATDDKRNLNLRLRAISTIGFVLRTADFPWSLPVRLGLDPSGRQPTPRLVASVL